MSLSKEDRIKKHLQACKQANETILKEGTVIATDSGSMSAGGRFCNQPAGATEVTRLRPIQIGSLQLNTVHDGRILRGRIIVPPLIMKSIMTLLEDDEGSVVMIAIYNLLPPGLQGQQLITAANNAIAKGSFIAVLEPFYKEFMDGTHGVRVDQPSKLMLNLEKGDSKVMSPGSGHEEATRSESQLTIGMEVTICALNSRKDLNGACGIIEEVLTNGRLQIHIAGSNQRVSVRKENIMLADDKSSSKVFLKDSDGAECANLKEEGDKQMMEHQWDKAITTYSKALSQFEFAASERPLEDQMLSLRLSLLCSRSLAFTRYGQKCAAMSDANRATDLDKRSAAAHEALAEAQLALGLIEEGKHSLETAIQCDPGTPNSETLRRKLAVLSQSASGVTHVLPDNLAIHLQTARPGSTLLLGPGLYQGPFIIDRDLTLIGAEGVIIDSQQITLTVFTSNRVVLSKLQVRNGAVKSPGLGNHALFVSCGEVTVSECTFSSTAGPALAIAGRLTSASLVKCEVTSSGAGGVLVAQNACVHAVQLAVSHCASSGIEVRQGGQLDMLDSMVCSNEGPGITVWCQAKAGHIQASKVFENADSGILCSDGELTVVGCDLHDNGWGISVEGGHATVRRCDVHHNAMNGILLQAKANAVVEHNNVHRNWSEGIFVGFDAVGQIALRDNTAHDNEGAGILNGASKSKKVSQMNNREFKNKNNPKPKGIDKLLARANQGKLDVDEQKWLKRVRKLGGGTNFEESLCENAPHASVAAAIKAMNLKDSIDAQIADKRKCLACGVAEGSSGSKLLTCRRCRSAHYCSKACQASHWKKAHKAECVEFVDFPAFGQPGRDIRTKEAIEETSESPMSDIEAQLKMIERGMALGDKESAVAKAYLFLRINDFESARKLLLPAAEAGSLEAQCQLGFMYERGHGFAQDFHLSEKWYLSAAEGGLVDAMARLGNLYAKRKAMTSLTSPDRINYEQRARKWWETALSYDLTVTDRVPQVFMNDENVDPELAAALSCGSPDAMEKLIKSKLLARHKNDAAGHPIRLEGLLNFATHCAADAKLKKGPYSHGPKSSHSILTRIQAMTAAIESDGEDVMKECAAFLRALQLSLEFQNFMKRGMTDQAHRALHDALYLDEKAVLFESQDERNHILSRARQTINSPDPSIRSVSLYIVAALSEPVDSIPILSQLVKEAPSARAFEMLGSMHGFLGDWNALIQNMQSALRIDPSYYSAHYALGVAHKQEERYSDAILHLTAYLGTCPPDSAKIVNALYAKAFCLFFSDDASWDRRAFSESVEQGLMREKNLEKFWGAYHVPDKIFLDSVDISNPDQARNFFSMARSQTRSQQRPLATGRSDSARAEKRR